MELRNTFKPPSHCLWTITPIRGVAKLPIANMQSFSTMWLRNSDRSFLASHLFYMFLFGGDLFK